MVQYATWVVGEFVDANIIFVGAMVFLGVATVFYGYVESRFHSKYRRRR